MMSLKYDYEVDKVNKILIFEAQGTVSDIREVERLIKTVVKTAGKNQMSNVVIDIQELDIKCSSLEISNLLVDIKSADLLANIKLARIINHSHNIQHLVGELAKKLNLPIKNFETRSEAILWLLFNKIPK
ncbi:hypothetical protein RS130_12365 [Paraglaciecola aquimarina]|uniref:STAS domain-containing protein n=1 Tax=Paraglaciecola aquimarina TaxID=1235557 RepID=A0ABU3SX67_9ALTE|nr:hypothetical protein [Paraglaciecola aquimarina]MDU0354610.1 hypothetical protein [Paraglaciecola aquimarina]